MRFYFLAALLLLSACANKDAPQFSCPQLGFIKGYDVQEFKDKQIKVEINGIQGGCTANDESNEIALDLTLPFKAVSTAAKHDDEEMKVTYSVSLISEDEELLLRKLFTADLEFDSTGNAESEEGVDIVLPVQSMKEGYKYKVVVGMTKE